MATGQFVSFLHSLVPNGNYLYHSTMEGLEKELERFKRSFHLTEAEDKGVVIVDGQWNNDTDSHALCLVGRVLTSKTYKFDALSTSIKSMIDPVRGMNCQQLLERHFLLRFYHTLDRECS
ncbi:UNVERIFIED_CONTAM: hypothetical protein Sradi_1575100 [Sesamum radiatum]|uniref:Uncharacterized protein n=1 Tax=Sesamum radiatum TaxID=300843 RepID=A0AAW2UA48_SESRA